MTGDAPVPPDSEAAERALALLAEMSPEMRAAAILSADGAVLAADGSADDWAERVEALLGELDAAGDEDAEHVHVATEAGEIFVTRLGGLVAVAVTERFVLASLMAFDMRSLLGDLSRGDAPDHVTANAGES